MNNLSKLIRLFLILINNSLVLLAMEKEVIHEELPLLSSMNKENQQSLTNLLKQELAPDICNKLLTLQKTDLSSCQDVCRNIISWYYLLLLEDKYQHMQFVRNNSQFMNAIVNNKKCIIIDPSDCYISYKIGNSYAEKLLNAIWRDPVLVEEIYILDPMTSVNENAMENAFNILLNLRSLKMIKTDLSLFKDRLSGGHLCQHYGGKLTRTITLTHGVSKEIKQDPLKMFNKNPIKPDLHLYLDFHQFEFSEPQYDAERCTTIANITYKEFGIHSKWWQKSSFDLEKFSFDLENSGAFKIICINTNKPYNQKIYTSKPVQDLEKTQEQNHEWGYLNWLYNMLPSVSNWFWY